MSFILIVIAIVVLLVPVLAYVFFKLTFPRCAEDRWNSCNRTEFHEKSRIEP